MSQPTRIKNEKHKRREFSLMRASQFELSEKSEIMRYGSWATEAFLPRESWMRRISFRAG
jgi:hypothetical protein